jgi:hypothetical protein
VRQDLKLGGPQVVDLRRRPAIRIVRRIGVVDVVFGLARALVVQGWMLTSPY